MTQKRQNVLQRLYINHMRSNLGSTSKDMSPMAIYQWFVKDWDRPLNAARQQTAYLAAWAVSIDNGTVNL